MAVRLARARHAINAIIFVVETQGFDATGGETYTDRCGTEFDGFKRVFDLE